MKFFVVLGLLVLLLVSTATGAMAAAVGYLDMVANGVVDQDANPTPTGQALGLKNGQDDLAVSIISAGTIINDKYKIGAEYGIGSVKKTGDDENLTLRSIKVGYRLVSAKAFKLDAIVAPLNINANHSQLDTLLYGFDAAQYFSTKMFLTLSYVVGDGEYQKDGLKDDKSVPTNLLRIKFHYFFNDNIGAVAGYTGLNYKFNSIHPMAGNLGTMDVHMGGPTLGLVYKF